MLWLAILVTFLTLLWSALEVWGYLFRRKMRKSTR